MLRIPVWNAIRGFPDRGFMKSLSIRQTGLRPGQLIFAPSGQGKALFLMVSYVRPHPPLDAPQCYLICIGTKAKDTRTGRLGEPRGTGAVRQDF